MNIVVEGPDNSGKSTLVDRLHQRIGFRVIASKGRASPETWGHRFMEFDGEKCVIFDRHVCISEPIYSEVCRRTPVPRELTRRFYASKPLIIYCQNTRGLNGHVGKNNHKDTPEHLAILGQTHHIVCGEYDRWAIKHAHIIYRMGEDDPMRVVEMVEAAL